MTAESVVREAIIEQLCDSAFDDDSTFDDLGADSLDLVEILNIIEDKTGKIIDEKDLGNIETVGDMVRLLGKYL